jgi:outer membrane lipopolysaccharide assembly protein LptE/RlpB
MNKIKINLLAFSLLVTILSGCRVYSFKDAVIPSDVKTIKIGFFENRARYVNPQLGKNNLKYQTYQNE